MNTKDKVIDKIYKINKSINGLMWGKIEDKHTTSKTTKRVSWGIAVVALLFCGYTLKNILQYYTIPLILAILVLYCISYKNELVIKNVSWGELFVVIAVAVGNYSWFFDACSLLLSENNMLFIIGCVSMMIVVVYICLIICAVLIDYDCFNIKQFHLLYWNLFVNLFVLALYIPSESYFSNISDFNIRFKFILAVSLPIIIIVPYIISTIVSSFSLNKYFDFSNIVSSIVCGCTIASWYQYMFGNKLLKTLDGTNVHWENHTKTVILNLMIWIGILSLFVVIKKINKCVWKKIMVGLPCVVLGIHAFSLIGITISGIEKEQEYCDAYVSYEEQFVVSPQGNVVVLVIDACDNDFVEYLYNEKREVFDGFADFTMYTDTCSVYDSSAGSIMTIMAGADFHPELSADEWYHSAWNTPKTSEFYKRMKEARYKINYYNFVAGNPLEWIGRIDNVVPRDKVRWSDFKYEEYIHNMKTLALYRTSPYLVKMKLDANSLSFYEMIRVDGFILGNYENEDFEKACSLKLANTNKPYLIYQHISGVHDPCEDYYGMTEYCLSIAEKYIAQMKSLGVYDDATILVIADHGRHEGDSLVPLGSTPMFMIKEPHATHEEIQQNEAPIYYTDIIPTILSCIGKYDENNKNDIEILGTSIYMHKEGEQRERIWYDRWYEEGYKSKYSRYCDFSSTYNVYNMYKYTGDKEELKRKVEADEVDEVYEIYEFIG